MHLLGLNPPCYSLLYLFEAQLFAVVKSTLNSAAVLSPTHFTQNHACIFIMDVYSSQAVKHFILPFISKA